MATDRTSSATGPRIGRQGWLLVGLVVFAFGLGFLLTWTQVVRLPGMGPTAPEGRAPFDVDAAWGEEELYLVYLGSATCGWSNVEWLPAAVDSIKGVLSSRAERLGVSFATLGVAVDWSPDEGLAHLNRVGGFDEVAAGYSWMNIAGLQYLWTGTPGRWLSNGVPIPWRAVSSDIP